MPKTKKVTLLDRAKADLNTILASRREVDDVIKLCDKLFVIAENNTPGDCTDRTVSDVINKINSDNQ